MSVIEKAKEFAELHEATKAKDNNVAIAAYGNISGRAYEMAGIIAEIYPIVEAQEWNDNMDEAPRDGTPFEITDGRNVGYVYIRNDRGYVAVSNEPTCLEGSTHWKHKSLPPINKEKTPKK
jgi:hypothetical protein